jgi:hypothetical protein
VDVVVLLVFIVISLCVCTYAFRRSVENLLVVFIFVVLYWYAFTY